jgi:Domain of unknown function (DUF202)
VARDPGLQPERTSLAWTRTVMASFALAALLARLDAVHGWRGRGLPAGLALAAGAASWLGGRYRARHASPPSCAPAPRWLLGSIALATAATAAAAIALALPPG